MRRNRSSSPVSRFDFRGTAQAVQGLSGVVAAVCHFDTAGQGELVGWRPADDGLGTIQFGLADVHVTIDVGRNVDQLDEVVHLVAPDVNLSTPGAGLDGVANIDTQRVLGTEIRVPTISPEAVTPVK